LLASWYLAEPQKPAPPRIIPQPAGDGDRNAIPLYDFPRQRLVHHFIREMPRTEQKKRWHEGLRQLEEGILK
jgi:nicotinate dehydrogenase subunit B